MMMLPMLAAAFSAQGLLVDTTALAAVALVGYLFGRRQRSSESTPIDPALRDELQRAQSIAEDLARLTSSIGVEAAAHGRSVDVFRRQLGAMQTRPTEAEWPRLRDNADRLLGPTLKLYTNLMVACDLLRRQKRSLVAFTGSRIDHATGLQNRRSLEEQLDAFFSIHATGKRRFAVALFSVSAAGDDEPDVGESRLRRIAGLLEECLRDDDVAARYSQDEFVVLMPHTALSGALAFSERLLVRSIADLGCPVWGGVVEAASDETPEKLLSRADSALYSARAAGDSALFQHNGQGVRRHAVDLPPSPAAADGNWADSELHAVAL